MSHLPAVFALLLVSATAAAAPQPTPEERQRLAALMMAASTPGAVTMIEITHTRVPTGALEEEPR